MLFRYIHDNCDALAVAVAAQPEELKAKCATFGGDPNARMSRGPVADVEEPRMKEDPAGMAQIKAPRADRGRPTTDLKEKWKNSAVMARYELQFEFGFRLSVMFF